VGPPLMNFVTYFLNGPFGQTSRRRSPRELASVLRRELEQWDRGERNPAAIANYWRARLNPSMVCRELLAATRHVEHCSCESKLEEVPGRNPALR